MSLAKRIAFTLILVGASLTVALAVGEMLVRGLAPQAIMPNLFTFDTRVGHRLRPNAHVRHVAQNREFAVDVRTNSYGWRSRQLDDRPSVLLLGDSFTFGVGVEQSETFAAVLQDSIDALHGGLQVVNTGVGGRTPDQYWAEYHYNKHLTDPSLVIIAFYEGNDFIEQSELVSFDDVGTPLFALLRPSRRSYAFLRSAIQGAGYDALAQYSHLAVLAKNALYEVLAPEETDEVARDADAAFTFRILRGLHGEATADGAVVVVVIIPPRPGDYPPLDQRTDQLGARLRASDIPVLDLRGIMAGRRDYYFQGTDGHWNDRGHATAGAALYQFLREGNLVGSIRTHDGVHQ